MARAHRFLQTLPPILLACTALHADWLLDEAHKRLLAQSPSVKVLRDKLLQDCPGFTLSLSRENLPTLVQLRSWGPNRYAGVVNVDRVKATRSAPELAIASLYFMARQEVGKDALSGPRSCWRCPSALETTEVRSDPCRGHPGVHVPGPPSRNSTAA